MNSEQLEKYSSAITLSDMEIFVFPDLMYSLVLANIMSPILWQWREQDWYKKVEKKSPYRKLMRLKQFIMDEYEFNLDLNTWGLTHKDRELARFETFMSADDIAGSNALFGYHGDEYYFDVDIRRHFGLDQYHGDIIPYWKTETVEAMTAFRFKDGYKTGAGECVSLAALYAAAAFVICGIPLDDLYMILTPLHSQNYLDVNDGVITNNRRIVTKTMWFNGTAITMKAQRALRNERVTIVAHHTGHVHCFYDEATIDPQVYEKFIDKLNAYLTAPLDLLIFSNFLRCHNRYQDFFQFCTQRRGEPMFVNADTLFHYEHGSPYRIGEPSFDKLLAEVDAEDYSPRKISSRMCIDQLMGFVAYENIDLKKKESREKLAEYLKPFVPDSVKLVQELATFTNMEARLPSRQKQYISQTPIAILSEHSREEIIEYLRSIRTENAVADLAFYAYRDMETCDWEPFIKAAVERNPVSLEAAENQSLEQVCAWLEQMTSNSIYDGWRLAQPDEVVNYGTGDGLEKAIVLANVLRNREPGEDVTVRVDGESVVVNDAYRFHSAKGLRKEIAIRSDGSFVITD